MIARSATFAAMVLTLASAAVLPAQEPFTCFIGTSASAGLGESASALVGGALICRQQNLRPLAWFGSHKKPGEKPKYLYLLLFKTPEDFDGRGAVTFSADGGVTPEGHRCRMSVTLAGKKIDVAYRFDLDQETHSLAKQSLTIGDRELKEDDSRLMVIDLTKEPPEFHALDAPLPDEAPNPSLDDHDAWGATLLRAVEQLREKSPELKAE